MHEVGRRRVLRRGGWHHRERSRVADFVETRLAHERDAGIGAETLSERVQLAFGAAGGHVGCEQERPVRARTEPGADESVRVTRGGSALVVARIGDAEAQPQRGSGEGEQHAGAEDRSRPGSSLDQVAPTAGQRLAAARSDPAEAGNAPAVDAAAGEAEQRGQERHGRRHRDQNRDAHRDCDPVEEGHAQQEQAEKGDDDGRSGDQDAAPGRGHGLDDGGAWLAAGGKRCAEAGQDQERVVDPDADPDHARDRGGKTGDVHGRSQEADHQDREPEPEERDHNRQPNRHDRAEGDQEDDRGRDQTDELGAPTLLRVPDRRAPELDSQPVAGRRLGHRDQARRRFGRHVQGGAVELEASQRDCAVARDARRLGTGDALETLDPGQEALDAGEDRRVAGAGARLPHHVDRVARGAGEALGDQIGRSLRFRSTRCELGGELPGKARGHGDRGGEHGDPHEHHPAAAAVGEVSETGKTAARVGRGSR